MSRLALIAALVLGGCTINVVDQRLSREEVIAAFAQRDAAIKDLLESVKKIDEKVGAKK